MPYEVEPRLVVQSNRIHHQGIAVPATNRIAPPGFLDVGIMLPPINEDLPEAMHVALIENQEELRSLAQKQGMRTLRTEAINLVAEDITTVAEVIRSMYTL